MLVLKRSQLVILNEILRKAFIRNALVHIKKKFKDYYESKTTEELIMLIKNELIRAERYNIDEQSDVLRFIEFTIELGNEFEQKPENDWAKETLLTRNFSGSEKIINLNKQYLFLAK